MAESDEYIKLDQFLKLAQIAMTGPGFVIMLVCMAIMAGPFLMNLLPLMMGGATDGGLFSQ